MAATLKTGDPKTKRVKMETFRVHAYCECGGEWRSQGTGISNSQGTQWHHICSTCGESQWFGLIYPAIEHEVA